MNKVMLIGNVGKDPNVRYFDHDQAQATFPLATTERGYILQNGTQVPDKTDWHNIVLYRGLAKIAEKYVHKGDKLYIEGRVRYRSYDDNQGNKRYITEIYGENMELLSPRGTYDASRNQAEPSSPSAQMRHQMPTQTPTQANNEYRVQAEPIIPQGASTIALTEENDSDDLPF